MRCIALDVHRDFCEVAIAEAGEVRLVGRVKTEPEALELFARSLAATDWVALEATGNALAIARIIEPHVVASCSPIRKRSRERRRRRRRTRSTRGRWHSC